MSYEVLLLGLLVGCVNYCFRYFAAPFWAWGTFAHKTRRDGHITRHHWHCINLRPVGGVYRARSDARHSSVRAYAGGVCHTGRKLL